MAADIRQKRGLRANLPAQDNNGVLLIATDTREMFMGQGGGFPLLNLSKPLPKVVTGSWASVVNVDGNDIDVVRVTLGGNTVINMVNGGRDGQKLMLELTQDGNGNRTVTLGTGFGWGADITSFSNTATPSKTDIIGLIYNQPSSSWRVIAIAKGY